MPLVLLDVGKPETRFSMIKFLEAEELEAMKLEVAFRLPEEDAEIIAVFSSGFFANQKEGEVFQSFNKLLASTNPQTREKIEFFLTIFFQYAEFIGLEEARNRMIVAEN